MHLVTGLHRGIVQTGLLLGERVLPLAAALQRAGVSVEVSSMLAIIRGGEPVLALLRQLLTRAGDFADLMWPLAEMQLLAPIPTPARNPFCVGRNYLDHIKEGLPGNSSDIALPSVPQFFTKATHAVNAPHGEVLAHAAHTKRLDYEVELAVVVGKAGRDIPRGRAFEHVFGYCVANDITARDLQRRHEQWFKGKSLDTTLPLGPALVTADEIADVGALQLSLSVNGELRQQAKAAQMIFDIPAIIESLSAGLTLEPGDVICTGTPSGVGYAMNPPQYLKPGDVVVARIEGLGELRNRIVG